MSHVPSGGNHASHEILRNYGRGWDGEGGGRCRQVELVQGSSCKQNSTDPGRWQKKGEMLSTKLDFGYSLSLTPPPLLL